MAQIDYQGQYNQLVSLREKVLPDKISQTNWSEALRPLIENAALNAVTVDANAATFMSNPANRRFFINNDVVPHDIIFNGKKFTIQQTTSYPCHPKEWDYFIKFGQDNGFNFGDDPNGSLFLGGQFDGLHLFFFYS